MRMLIVDNYVVTVNTLFNYAYYNSTAQSCDNSMVYPGYIADYTLNIENQVENPSISNIIRTQVGYDTGTYIYGSTDIPTIRLKTITKGCNTDILRELRLIGKNGVDINNKIGVFNVYANNKDSFDKVKLIKSYQNPVFVGNQYTFSNINDSLNSVIVYDSAIRYYWIRLNATKQNVAVADSIKLGLDSLVGNVGTIVQNDSNIKNNGFIKLLSPTKYIGSRSMQYDTNFLSRGTNDNIILGFQIENRATGAPIPLTNLYLNTLGSSNIGFDISKLKVYYTGNNPVFSTGVVYGDSSVGTTKTGNVYLNGGTNYFWLSVNVSQTATIGNRVLLGIDSFKLYDTVYTPVKTGVIGAKKITYNYCKNIGLKNGGNYISRLRLSNLVNNKDTTAALAALDSGGYNDYSGLSPANLKQGTLATMNIQTTRYSGADTNQLSVYIDWNNNGGFSESNELAYRSAKALTSGLFYGIKINVPCSSSTGLLRMRVVYGKDTVINGCVVPAGVGSSVTDDYTVNIQTNPLIFVSADAVQQGGNYYPGTNNVPIFQLPVVVGGCGVAKTDSMLLSGYGSTNLNNDVSVVKLYKTGNSNIFNPFKLLDTALIKSNDPSYLINFNKIKDTLSNIANGGSSDTTYYWLTYNIKPGAALGNVLDAIYLNYYWGGTRVQVNQAPEGVVSIGSKASFISSTVQQADTLSNIFVGSSDNILEQIKVVISDTGAPLNLYSLYVNTHGTTDTLNIRDIKGWFTGSSSTYNTNYPLGFVQSNRGNGLYKLSGNQLLQNGVNYIWITASVNSNSASGNSLAIGIDSILVDTLKQGVLFNAVARKIQGTYCTPVGIPANSGYISSVQIGSTSNTSDCASTAVGVNSIPILYGNYTQLVEPIRLGEILNIQLNTGFCNGIPANYRPVVYIDWNQNGVFETSDSVYISNSISQHYSIQIPIPCYANLGKTRIRIIYALQTEAINKGCLSSNNGLKNASVQDYSLLIMAGANQNTGIVSKQIVTNVNPFVKDALLYQFGVKNGGCPLVKLDSLYFNTIGSSNFIQDIDSIKLYKTGTSNVFSNAQLLGALKVQNNTGLIFKGLNDTIKNIGAGNLIDTNYYWVSVNMSKGAIVGDTVNLGLDSMYISGNLNVYNKQDTIGKVIIGSFNIGAVQNQLDNLPISINQRDYAVVRIAVTDTIGYSSNVSKVYVSKIGSNPLKSVGYATLWYTGSSNQFAKTGQFGVQDTTTINENIVFTGSQNLVKGTNYFWLTYSVVSGRANIGDTLRIRADSVQINDTNVGVNPLNAGDYKIVRQGYPSINKDSNNGGYISRVSINEQTLIIDSNQYKTSTKVYVDSTNAVQKLGVLQQGVLYNVQVNTGNYKGGYNRLFVYVDWNNNGLFNNAGEQIIVSKSGSGDQNFVVPIKVPCSSNLGSLRMRLLFVDSVNTGQDSTNYGIDFKRGGVVLDASLDVTAQVQQWIAQQIPQRGGYLAKTRNVPIVSVPVVLTGCGIVTIDTLLLNVNGSYDTNDLSNIKVYKTLNRGVFDTTQLIATRIHPFNSNIIKLGLQKKDTLQNFANNNSSDTNYYWIATDISGDAKIGDTLRLKIDSVYVLNGYKEIGIGDTLGYPVIQKPINFIGITNTYIDTNSIAQNSKNNILLKTAIEMGVGESVRLSKIYIDSIGTNKLRDIDTIKLWYTGLNNAFQTPQLIGKIIKPTKNNLTLTGEVLLQTGTNYVWTTVDLASDAVIGNYIALGIDSVRIFDTNYKPSIANPMGIKRIRGAYCTNTGVNNSNNYIQQIGFNQTNYVLDTMAHSSYINNINNSSIGLQKATRDTLRITVGSYDTAKNNVLLVYIDWNNDGDLSDVGELVYRSSVDSILSKTYLVPVSVPCDVVRGNTLLRVIYTQKPINASDSNNILQGFCLNKSVVSDLNVQVKDNPIQVVSIQSIKNRGLYDKADTNVGVLKMEVVVQGCGVLGLSSVQVNTIGTNHIEDITKIRLYSSRNTNMFSQSSKLLASKTITNETGSLITLNGFYDTLQSYYTGKVSDTNYYWVNYDIENSSVVYGDTLNGNIDSLIIGDSIYTNRTPLDSVGEIYIRVPKAILSTISINPDTKPVLSGSINNVVMKIKVEVGEGSSVPLTNLYINHRGTDSLWAIDRVKVWFTGSKDSFYTSSQFGTTITPNTYDTNIVGNQLLQTGTNIFWVTYDINTLALGRQVHAGADSIRFYGNIYRVDTSAQLGSKLVEINYCSPINYRITSASNFYISLVSLKSGGLNNVAYNPLVSNYVERPLVGYWDYTDSTNTNQVAVEKRGTKDTLFVRAGGWLTVGGARATGLQSALLALVDWNNDGVFGNTRNGIKDTSYRTILSATRDTGILLKIPLEIPCNVTASKVRLRVQFGRKTGFCLDSNDYKANILVYDTLGCDLNSIYGEPEYRFQKVTQDYAIKIPEGNVAVLPAVKQSGSILPSKSLVVMSVPIVSNQYCTVDTINSISVHINNINNALDIAKINLYTTGSNKNFVSPVLMGSDSLQGRSILSFKNLQKRLPNSKNGGTNDTSYYWVEYQFSNYSNAGDSIGVRLDSLYISGKNVGDSSIQVGSYLTELPLQYQVANISQVDTTPLLTNSVDNQILKIQYINNGVGYPVNLTRINFNLNGTSNLNDISNIKYWFTGNSKVFNTNTQFGGTLGTPSSKVNNVITGNVTLLPDTNYIWVTASIANNAIYRDSLFISIDSMVVYDSVIKENIRKIMPYNGRIIKGNYCTSLAGSNLNGEIYNVRVGTLNNTSDCNTNLTTVGSIKNRYSNYTLVAATDVQIGEQIPFGVTIGSCTILDSGRVAVYVDWNADGVFNDTTERMYLSGFMGSSFLGTTIAGSIKLPCNAVVGNTRLRVVYFTGNTVSSCGSYNYGETEDYTINITSNPIRVVSVAKSPVTRAYLPGTGKAEILQLSVVAKGCGIGEFRSVQTNQVGTTNLLDVDSIQLYSTGNNPVFSQAGKLLKAIKNDTGYINTLEGFKDTLKTALNGYANDTNYYWFVYKLSPSAIIGDTINLNIDSIKLIGDIYRFGIDSVGKVIINNPLPIISVQSINLDTKSVLAGSINNVVMKLKVTAGIGAPVPLTNIFLNHRGTDSLWAIDRVKVWFTGSTDSFYTSNQFGTTIAPKRYDTNIVGNQLLQTGTNIFWVTYDINALAVGRQVHAGADSIRFYGDIYKVDTSAQLGSKWVDINYCSPINNRITSASNFYISSVSLKSGGINNATYNPLASNFTERPLVGYWDYTDSTNTNQYAVEKRGTKDTLFVRVGGWRLQVYNDPNSRISGYQSALFALVDWNNDGVFSNTRNGIKDTNYHTNRFGARDSGVLLKVPLEIPCNVTASKVRMRVQFGEYTSFGLYGDTANKELKIVFDTLGCDLNSIYSGEPEYRFQKVTHDYAIKIPEGDVAVLPAVKQSGSILPGKSLVVMSVPIVSNQYCTVDTINSISVHINNINNALDIAKINLYTTGSNKNFVSPVLMGTDSLQGRSILSFKNLQKRLPNSKNGGNNDTSYYWVEYQFSNYSNAGDSIGVRLDSLYISGKNVGDSSIQVGGYLTELPLQYQVANISQVDTMPLLTNSVDNKILKIQYINNGVGYPVNLTRINFNLNGSTNLNDISNIKYWFTGNSKVFNTNTQFGGTLGTPSSKVNNVITGNVTLLPDTNYIWVTMGIGNAANYDSIQISIDSLLVYDSVIKNNIVKVAPYGARYIYRDIYCSSGATVAQNEDIYRVNIGALDNSSTCNTFIIGNNSVQNRYSNYTNLTPTDVLIGATIPFNIRVGSCSNTLDSMRLAIFIDLNGNGEINDTSEILYISNRFLSPKDSTIAGFINVPCSINYSGKTRLRVVYSSAATLSLCGGYNFGETEDYTVNLVNNIQQIVGVKTIQGNSKNLPGTINVPVLQIPIVVRGSCNVLIMDSITINTLDSIGLLTNVQAIKLYKTNSGVFNTQNLFDSVNNPTSGVYTFGRYRDILQYSDNGLLDTNYYWIAVDLKSTAKAGDILSFGVKSIYINNQEPIQNDSIVKIGGVVLVDTFNNFVGATQIQTDSTELLTGIKDTRVLHLRINMDNFGKAVTLKSLQINAFGTTQLSDITNIKVWSTGSKDSFYTLNQFGNTISNVRYDTNNIQGAAPLNYGENHFWLTYSISTTASINNKVKVGLDNLSINYQNLYVNNYAIPAGVDLVSRNIQLNVCSSGSINPNNEQIYKVQIGGRVNTSLANTLASGDYSVAGSYSNYTNLEPVVVKQGDTISLRVNVGTNVNAPFPSKLGIYIDWNQDRIFNDSTELVYQSPVENSSITGRNYTVLLRVPCNANIGNARVRLIYLETNGALPLNGCGSYGYGETEDYAIQINKGEAFKYNNYFIQSNIGTLTPGVEENIMQIGLIYNGCTSDVVKNMVINTAGTTNILDIAGAKLYKIINNSLSSNFSNNLRLLDSSTSFGNGIIRFSRLLDTVQSKLGVTDTVQYVLRYAIKADATNRDSVITGLDSLVLQGNNIIVSPVIRNRQVIQYPTYTITTAVQNGVITNSQNVLYNGNGVITYSPNIGFYLANIRLNGQNIGLDSVSRYSFSQIKSNQQIQVTYNQITDTIQSGVGLNGTINLVGRNVVNYNSNYTYTITPNLGYQVDSIVVNGVVTINNNAGLNSYTFSNIQRNHTLYISFRRIVYNIQLLVNNGGTVLPGLNKTNYFYGDTQTYTIQTNSGYILDSLIIDGVVQNTQNVMGFVFNNIQASHNVVVKFSLVKYNIVSTANAGGSISPLGTSVVNRDSTIRFTIVANKGYIIDSLRVNNRDTTKLGLFVFDTVRSNQTIDVRFKKIQYRINASAGMFGQISPVGERIISYGDNSTYSITPNIGYEIDSLIVDSVRVNNPSNTYTFLNDTANHSIRVTFRKIVYNIRVISNEGGFIQKQFNKDSFYYGEYQNLSYTLQTGYRVDSILIDGINQNIVSSSNILLSNINADHIIKYVFKKISYTIVSSAGANGSIIPGGNNVVNYGDSIIFSIMPDINYQIDSIIVDGNKQNNSGTYKFRNVVSNHTIRVTFKLVQVAVIGKAGANGSISPIDTSWVNYGGGITYNFTPNASYQVDSVIVNGVAQNKSNSITLSNIISVQNIRVTFRLKQFRVIASTLDTNGSITPLDTVVNYGDNLVYSITPNIGYQIDSIKIDGIYQNNKKWLDTIKNIVTNRTVLVSFKPLQYRVITKAGINGVIVPADTTLVNYNNKFTYTILPNIGYSVDSIFIDSVYGINQSLQDSIVVTKDRVIRATFKSQQILVRSIAGVGGEISYNGDTLINYGSSINYTITPAVGYEIDSVILDGIKQVNNANFILSNIIATHTIRVSFKRLKYVITGTIFGNQGRISTLSDTLYYGSSLRVTYQANGGYNLAYILINNNIIIYDSLDGYTFNNITQNYTITPIFTFITIPNPPTNLVALGGDAQATVSFAAPVNNGGSPIIRYNISTTEGNITASGVASPIVVTGLTNGVNYRFVVKAVNAIGSSVGSDSSNGVTPRASGKYVNTLVLGGQITNTAYIDSGVNFVVTYTKKAGYVLDSIYINGVYKAKATTDSLNQYTFKNVRADSAIKVVYKITTYTITANAGNGGSISPQGVSSVNYGATPRFTITPNTGYLIDSVLLNNTLVK